MLISWGVGVGVGGGGVRVELWSDVVPRDRKLEESVSLGMGHSFTRGYHWSRLILSSLPAGHWV